MTLFIVVVVSFIICTITTWSRGDGSWVEASPPSSSSLSSSSSVTNKNISSYSAHNYYSSHPRKGWQGKGGNSYFDEEWEQQGNDDGDEKMEGEEFVTSFYKRAQEKQRALINGYAARSHGGGLSGTCSSSSSQRREDAGAVDHSLDHYFHRCQHPLLPSSRVSIAVAAAASSSSTISSTDDAGVESRPHSPFSSSSWSMRGGGTMMMTTTPLEAGTSDHHSGTADKASRGSRSTCGGHLNRKSSLAARNNHHHHHNHRRQQQQHHHDDDKGRELDEASRQRSASTRFHSSLSLPEEQEGDNDDNWDEQNELSHYLNDIDDGDDEQHSDAAKHHCPGLLRVPCSITINSGDDDDDEEDESSSLHHHHHHHKKTPVAAFVDTGAQVTVISASAARRAGIYHLIDRRYAGRATGVGHCKVLGRIPARHVYFLLGGGGEEEEEERGGKGKKGRRDQYFHESNNNHHRGAVVQMDGPALTVIEGTVTKGVDILLGLDVLQDWEAEIRIGPITKSISVTKRTRRRKGTSYSFASASSFGGGGDTSSAVVIPFVTSGSVVGDGGSIATSSKSAYTNRRDETRSKRNDNSRHARISHLSPTHSHADISKNKTGTRSHNGSNHSFFSNFRSISNSGGDWSGVHRHHQASQHATALASIDYDEQVEEQDDDDFSPIASDIESDLDLLDQWGHEFPDDGSLRKRQRIRSGNNILLGGAVGVGNNGSNLHHILDNDLPFGVIGGSNHDDLVEEEDEDYLQDVEDDCVVEGVKEEIDMSGL